MSESEKFEAQGRAQAALKRSKSNVATINVSLQEHARSFAEVGGLIGQLIRDPLFRNDGVFPLSEHLKTSVAQLPTPESIASLVDALVSESMTLKELQKQVDQF
jgi:hypothetical protein